jgi:hypothetical protein
MSDTEDLTASNSYIDAELVNRIKKIEDCFGADVITCVVPIMPPIDDVIRQLLDGLDGKRPNLLVLLETAGGSIETTERIADVFRHHYSAGEVSFLIPNQAMSAGTILVMCGDRILMDYYSNLGPIDPQIADDHNELVPGMGYLLKFDELVAKSRKGSLSPAELAFLLDKFDPAKLHWLEQAREHGVDLLKKWLVQYKFRNWTVTETRGVKVTQSMKDKRAVEIANKLNDTKRWRSHGRGISMTTVRDTLNLKVEDYGTDPAHSDLNRAVTAYYRLLKDYMGRRGWAIMIQTRQGRMQT